MIDGLRRLPYPPLEFHLALRSLEVVAVDSYWVDSLVCSVRSISLKANFTEKKNSRWMEIIRYNTDRHPQHMLQQTHCMLIGSRDHIPYHHQDYQLCKILCSLNLTLRSSLLARLCFMDLALSSMSAYHSCFTTDTIVFVILLKHDKCFKTLIDWYFGKWICFALVSLTQEQVDLRSSF